MEPPIHNTNKNKMTIFMMVCKQANIIPNASILTSIYEIVHYCMKELFPWIVHFIRFTVVLLHRAKQNMSWNWFNYTIPSIYHDSVQLSTKYNTYNHDTFSSRPAMLTHWWEKFPPWQGCKLALYRSMKVNILKAWVLGSVIPTSFFKNPTFIFHSYLSLPHPSYWVITCFRSISGSRRKEPCMLNQKYTHKASFIISMGYVAPLSSLLDMGIIALNSDDSKTPNMCKAHSNDQQLVLDWIHNS